MELKTLQQHIRTLATLPETDAEVISCYLTLETGSLKNRNVFDAQVYAMKTGLTGQTRRDVEIALDRIEAYLAADLLPDAKGLAVYSRAGEEAFFLPLQFPVPLPNWVAVERTPNIYHLVELKDTYHRYVVMISTEESARILEINVGSVTEELWKQRPELRKRVGREWTKAHYQNHRKDRTRKFIKETIEMLDQLMSAGGYTHLILAGHPTATAQVRSKLPKRLVAKLFNVVPASAGTPVSDIVEATIASFMEAEETESRSAVEVLERQIRTGGLAVAGTGACFQALERGQTDILILAKSYAFDPAWACTACGTKDTERNKSAVCPACGSTELRYFDIREEMVRAAEQYGCTVEIVNQSEALMQLGGVGCLLRYRLAEEYA
jgi:rubrerythrin